MYLDYLTERYESSDFLPLTLEEVGRRFEEFMPKNRAIYKDETGFASYHMEGDAIIIHDIFIKPDFRKNQSGQKLGETLFNKARDLGKRVAIGFTEIAGKNHLLGMKAMKAAGFKPAGNTLSRFIFIKGL